jgi:ribosomal protein L44E
VARRPVRPRTERRAEARAASKLAHDRERLAAIEPGGAPARPVDVESASQVEPHALAFECLRCGGPNRLDAHEAVTVAGDRLRVASLRCARCGARRQVWFRIAPNLPS